MRGDNGKRLRETGMPSRYAIAKAWEVEPRFVGDIEEPKCFACGWGKDWGECETLEMAWRRAGLERCHLVADSAGGGVGASNLALLCARCHREAPMTNDREVMLRWMKGREYFWVWFARQVKSQVAGYRLTEAELGLVDFGRFGAEVKRMRVDRHPQSTGEGLIAGLMGVVRRMADDAVALETAVEE